MKKYKFNNGATFIETILAMVILAIIIVPFMSAFVFSERGTVEAGDLLDASFVAQRKLEYLQSLNYRAAIGAVTIEEETGKIVREELFEGLFAEITAVPYHPANPRFFNLVVQGGTNNGNLYITTPTAGRLLSINTLTGDASVNLNLTANGYTITMSGNTSTLTGTLPSGSALILFNATQYSGDHTITLNVTLSGRTLDAHVYTSFDNDARILVERLTYPALRRFVGFTSRNFSMLRARVSIFESMMINTMPTAVMESILELPNW